MSTSTKILKAAAEAELNYDKVGYQLDLIPLAGMTFAEFEKVGPHSKFAALSQSFTAWGETTADEGITSRTVKMLHRAEKLSWTFMDGPAQQIDEVKYGTAIDTAVAHGVRALRGQTPPTAAELLCLVIAVVNGQGDGGSLRNMKIAAEATENFTMFDCYGPVSPSWEEEDAEDEAAPIAA
ncbi:hypothetical protein ASH00_09045 [Arthrobacter sp. Soil782]|uniref:hypothetical protein n=1 Tax=Arthrobacter sp. Soil782 TaxID=1736410 RepID=UPI0006F96374|nr:hypothetical protein [Arthrobacter sp. Soil782]KRF05603.1 hypothetical protein ASH00_09045 [Arthrobacter sp. Soil782]